MNKDSQLERNRNKNIRSYKNPILIAVCVGFMMVMGVLSSCQDDETFSASPSHLLTFSTDTVKMDTTFSTVPTPTKTFWVYNRSGAGIRCKNIRLEQGNQTGFRVNVDGVYLGQSEGYQVNDIDVRDKDSIRVFVELTSPMNQKEKPSLVTDNLVFTLESNVQQKVNMRAFSWDAVLMEDVVVSEDMQIGGTKPIVIKGGITVKEGATLTVTAGSTLYFHNDAGIDVYGKLNCEGAWDNNIVLRGDRIDHMFDYLPYDRVSGQWKGIHFYKSSYENRIFFTDIHSTYHGVVCDSSYLDKIKLYLYNSTIHNCQGYGLLSQHSLVDVYNTQITNTLKDCASFIGGGVLMRHCTLAQFYPFDSNRGVALRFTNKRNQFENPLYQFDVYNTLVTGYADDVVMGDFDDNIQFSYSFTNCVLRTPEVKEETAFKNIIWEDVEDKETGAEKNFKLIDTDLLIYDFRLSENSKAIDAGVKLEGGMSDYDRLGVKRGEIPDVGAYEFVEEKSENQE